MASANRADYARSREDETPEQPAISLGIDAVAFRVGQSKIEQNPSWDAEQIAIGVDGKYYFQFVNPKDGDLKKWPFSAPQYLLLNVAIGGDLGGPVDDTIFPVKMEVDYVRVYQP